MVELKWNWFAYNFDTAIADVRRVYDIAINALENEMERRSQLVEDHDRAVEAGEPDGIDRDERGSVIEDPRDYLIYDVNVVEEAINNFRKSIAISLFHGWERAARETAGLPNASFTDLLAALKKQGIQTHEQVDHLRKLANCLKHSSPETASRLFAVRPDLFETKSEPTKLRETDWYESVNITARALTGFFEAVAASGPKH